MSTPSSERVAHKWITGSPKVEITPPRYPGSETYYGVQLKPTGNYPGSINFGTSLVLSDVSDAFQAVKKALEARGARTIGFLSGRIVPTQECPATLWTQRSPSLRLRCTR